MTYNIHPLFVHFPIALLFVYSIIKIVPLIKWFPEVSWKPTERVLLLIGVASAFIASTTGEIAEHLVRPDHALVEMHSLFAGISTWIYGLLLLGELLAMGIPFLARKIQMPRITAFLTLIEKILTHKVLSKILAFFGLIAISVTGLLGGVIVYGVTADPVAGIVLKLLGL